MRALRRAASPARAVLPRLAMQVLGVLAIVLGILAMHSLNVAVSAPGHHATSVSTTAHHTEPGPVGMGNPGCEDGCVPVDHEMAAMTSCVLALLTSVVVVGALVVIRRENSRWGDRYLGLVDALRTATPSPPSLHVLSISRT